jgi:4'-phosphopantetheinyl transferase EntD
VALERLLPAGVLGAELFGAPEGATLVAEEEALASRAASATRRAEFAAVRHCARTCLTRLGHGAVPILPGPSGEPLWPAGTRGSMTHCQGYAAAAVAPASLAHSIGIDAEPDAPLPDGVLDVVATPGDRDRLDVLPGGPGHPCWDRLLFSAKESVYKAWFPLVGLWLGHEEAEMTINPTARTFGATLTRDDMVLDGSPVTRVVGSWTRERGVLVTAVVLTTTEPPTPRTGPRRRRGSLQMTSRHTGS